MKNNEYEIYNTTRWDFILIKKLIKKKKNVLILEVVVFKNKIS